MKISRTHRCFDRKLMSSIQRPKSTSPAPARPDAAARLSVSGIYARHRCERLCECRAGLENEAAVRALGDTFAKTFVQKNAELRASHLHRRWNVRDRREVTFCKGGSQW